MKRSMMVAVAGLVFVSSVMAQTVKVSVVEGGSYYHRAECLTVDEQRSVDLDTAIHDRFLACPECTPQRYLNGVLRDDGPSPYLKQQVALRGGTGAYQLPIKGRVQTLKERAIEEAKGPGAADKDKAAETAATLGAPGGAAAAVAAPVGTTPALAAAAAAAKPPPASTATGAVPGTLLQAAQFQPTPMQQAMTYYGQPLAQPATAGAATK